MMVPQLVPDNAWPPRARAAAFIAGELVPEPLTVIAEAMMDEGLTLDEFVRRERLKYSTVMGWLRGDEERWAAYEKAVDAAADRWAMETKGIADGVDEGGDVDGEGVRCVKRDKLRIDTRLRIAQQLSAQRWRPGLDVTVSDRPSIRRVMADMDRRLERFDEAVDAEFTVVEDDGEPGV